MKVAEVKFADIDRLYQSLKENPFRANRVVALLSKMLSLSIRWEMRSDNPASGVERFPEEPRGRYLKPEESLVLAKALAEHPDQDSADIVGLLMFTGARRGEVLAARWNHFDEGVWKKPSASTKSKRPHRVLLNAQALEVLLRLRERTGDIADVDLVFPGRGGVQRTDINKFWRSIRETTGLHDLRLHDPHLSPLRTLGGMTFATGVCEMELEQVDLNMLIAFEAVRQQGAVTGATRVIATSRFPDMIRQPR